MREKAHSRADASSTSPGRLHRANIARFNVPLSTPAVRSAEGDARDRPAEPIAHLQRIVWCSVNTDQRGGAARHNGHRLPSQVGQPPLPGRRQPFSYLLTPTTLYLQHNMAVCFAMV